MFLMATSAIGPGFITQTAQFTAQLGAAFAFAIVASIVIDIAVQLNVWRVIGVAGLRAVGGDDPQGAGAPAARGAEARGGEGCLGVRRQEGLSFRSQ